MGLICLKISAYSPKRSKNSCLPNRQELPKLLASLFKDLLKMEKPLQPKKILLLSMETALTSVGTSRGILVEASRGILVEVLKRILEIAVMVLTLMKILEALRTVTRTIWKVILIITLGEILVVLASNPKNHSKSIIVRSLIRITLGIV